MCGRYAIDANQSAITQHFHIHTPIQILAPRTEIFPSEPVPVVGVKGDGSGHLGIALMKWQYLPRWAKQKNSPVINAKAETFAFAGIWDSHDGKPGVCILTVPANTAVRHVHERMSAIVRPENYDRWLSPTTDPADLEVLTKPSVAFQESQRSLLSSSLLKRFCQHLLAWTLAPVPSERMELAEMASDKPTGPTLFD